ncbi:uncharacterized protein LOC131892243 [Tigriopus californicus]|uniref:uncharacterized protein LOC131892243 n=1 Tax=Tigriopus californicus TaxID=6832 RepID=UPI0027DAAA20|nr:uncharacterized protein LOC131892243 [Tigriopus californicus]
MAQTDIAKQLNVDRKTIFRVKKHLQDEESMDRKSGGGRPVKIPSAEIKNAVMANPTKSIMSHAIDLGVSKDNVSRAIRMEGGKSLVMKKKPLLTPDVKGKHLLRCKGLLNNLKSAAGGRVILFSDEKTWTVDHVHKRRNDRFIHRQSSASALWPPTV